MNRETWIPIAGLVGLFLAGTIMLYATSGPPAPPSVVPAAEKAAKTAPATKVAVDAKQLTTKRPVGERAAPPEGAKNVVLVVVSAWRKDQLSPYGGPEAVTPWLAELAEQGVRFDDTIAAGGWSRPAIASITTGEHALALDLVEESMKAGEVTLPPGVPTLAERLAERGWYTMGVNAIPHAGRSTGLARGFDHFRDAHEKGYAPNLRLGADEAVQVATTMLRQRNPQEKERPFLLELHLVDLHKPIRVPPAEFEPFVGDDHEIAPYRAVLNRVDKALAKLDAGLEKLGELDDTYVVVVGAIGEGLQMPPRHGHAHGRNLFPSTAEVAWLVRGPEVPAGQVVEGLASQLDVTPTVLGLLGFGGPVGEGLDHSKLVRTGGRTNRTEAIVDTWYYAANRAAIYTPSRGCIKDFGSAALEEEGWVDGCYDRASDPEFTTPIEDAALMGRLDAFRRDTKGSKAVASGAR